MSTTTVQSPKPPLPDPDERPGTDLVVFDGECQFCRRQVDRLRRFDSRNQLSFLSLHDPRTREICPNLSHEQLMEQMYVVEPNGRQHGGAEAIRYLSRKLPRLWPVMPFLHLPCSMPVWKWLYRQVAIRRYRWNRDACETGTCRVHWDR